MISTGRLGHHESMAQSCLHQQRLSKYREMALFLSASGNALHLGLLVDTTTSCKESKAKTRPERYKSAKPLMSASATAEHVIICRTQVASIVQGGDSSVVFLGYILSTL